MKLERYSAGILNSFQHLGAFLLTKANTLDLIVFISEHHNQHTHHSVTIR